MKMITNGWKYEINWIHHLLVEICEPKEVSKLEANAGVRTNNENTNSAIISATLFQKAVN